MQHRHRASPSSQKVLLASSALRASRVTLSYILGHPGWGRISCSINMEIPSLPVSTWKTPYLLMCLKWLERITDSMDMNLSKLWGIVKDRKAWHVAVHGATKIWTWLSEWTTWQKNQEKKIDLHSCTVSALHTNLQVVKFQRWECVFACPIYVK